MWNDSIACQRFRPLTPRDPDDVGSYTIEVVALDGCGGSSFLGVELNVLPANTPPAADANGPYAVDEGDSVSLDRRRAATPTRIASTLDCAWDLEYRLLEALDVSLSST
jgi:hypothetical protein